MIDRRATGIEATVQRRNQSDLEISMLIIPAIDLRAGRCVRLSQGRKDATTTYDKDPVEVAEGFERSGAACFTSSISMALFRNRIRAIARCCVTSPEQ